MKIKVIILFYVLLHVCHANAEANHRLFIDHSILEQINNISSTDNDSIHKSSAEEVLEYFKEKNFPITTGNQVKLLKSGHDKFEDLFEMVREAKHHIHLEYFNFRNDSIANALFDLLAVKAKEGVEVRALFDAFGNWSNNKPLKKKHIKAIRDKGIEIVEFDPLKFPYLNHITPRDHRKIVVIDGKIGYTGGMNIADYYIVGLPEIGAWRDMHIRIEGPAVNDLQDIFLDIWNEETKQKIGGDIYYSQYKSADDAVGNVTIAIVDRKPKVTPKAIREAYAASILAADNYIRIVNPYFVPPRSIRKALKKALKKGVTLEIMASAKADIFFTPDASMFKLHKLMKKGAHVYLYNSGFHHSKIMMIDSTFCTVGTANLDSRSLRYDYETNAFIFDSNTTAELDKQFDEDKLDCTKMTKEYWKKRKPFKKFVGWFANLFTPVL